MIPVIKGLAVVSLGVASLALASRSSVATAVHATSAGTVTICHYPAHREDYVTANKPDSNGYCRSDGGTVMTIGIPGCQNGHHARPYAHGFTPEARTCADGDGPIGPPT